MLFKVMYCLKINLLSLLTSAARAGGVYRLIHIQGQMTAKCWSYSIATQFHFNTMHCSLWGFYQGIGQMCLLTDWLLMCTVPYVHNIRHLYTNSRICSSLCRKVVMMSDWQHWKRWRDFVLPLSLNHKNDNKAQNREKQQDQLFKNLSSLDWTEANANGNSVPEEMKLYMELIIFPSWVHLIPIKLGLSSV